MFENLRELNKVTKIPRESRTEDIVKRLGVITTNRVHLKKFPLDNPVVVFNPSMAIEKGIVALYGRITLGYYTYASAVAELKIPLEDVYDNLSLGNYAAEIKVLPDNKFDICGVEDPRVYEINGKKLMTYCGRTVDYFNPAIRTERTLPVTAVLENGDWRKLGVFRLPPGLRKFVVSDKNAFLAKMGDGLRFFHRVHMRDENDYVVVSKVPEEILGYREFTEITVCDTVAVLEKAEFEDKIGWGTPPVKIDKEYLFLLHGVGRETKHYRVFALLMDDKMGIKSITPYYIMGPKELYEFYGDRPFVVFPCGAQAIDDKILISYGAADLAVGIGEIDISEIMSILDSNRIE